jgi:hypothetical protein
LSIGPAGLIHSDPIFELALSDPLIKAYQRDLQHLKDQLVTHELGLKGPFQNLLDKAAKRRGWTLVPELSTYSVGLGLHCEHVRALRHVRGFRQGLTSGCPHHPTGKRIGQESY